MSDQSIASSGISRFAPSPTGPLHFGSMLTAVGSWLEARSNGQAWHLRIDDLDPPREMPGAADAILHTLERFSLSWDGPVVYQSRRQEAYAAALESLQQQGELFPCACSRADLKANGVSGPYGPVYPGTCRDGLADGKEGRAIRVRVGQTVIVFIDRIQGRVRQDLRRELGDFVVKRADGLYAYHIAVAVDDAELGVSDVVRGVDLMDSTARQIHLQQLLGLPTPRYAHFPIACNSQGQKLSKQTYAAAVDRSEPNHVWWQVLDFLAQDPPKTLQHAPIAEIQQWALQNWNLQKVPKRVTRSID